MHAYTHTHATHATLTSFTFMVRHPVHKNLLHLYTCIHTHTFTYTHNTRSTHIFHIHGTPPSPQKSFSSIYTYSYIHTHTKKKHAALTSFTVMVSPTVNKIFFRDKTEKNGHAPSWKGVIKNAHLCEAGESFFHPPRTLCERQYVYASENRARMPLTSRSSLNMCPNRGGCCPMYTISWRLISLRVCMCVCVHVCPIMCVCVCVCAPCILSVGV